MSVYKKINKKTGEEVIRYVVYDGDDKQIDNDIYHFTGDGCVLDDWEYSHFFDAARGYLFIVQVHDQDAQLGLFLKIAKGMMIVPFEVHKYGQDSLDWILDFKQARTYWPNQLEELYPDNMYDTVEV